MVDSFNVRLRREIAEPFQVWSDMRVVVDEIGSAQSITGKWHLTEGDRKWLRATLNELRKVAWDEKLTTFNLLWAHASTNQLWTVIAVVDHEHPSILVAEMTGGKDRMATERVARAIGDAAREQGVDLTVDEVKISSVDLGPELATEPPVSAVPRLPLSASVGVMPGGWWKRLGGLIQSNLPSFIVAVAAGLTVIAVAVGIGLQN